MADWRTYAKAARNTARKQAPGARDAARRATDRAGDYVRAAGRAVDGGWKDDRDQADGPARERTEVRTREREPRDPQRAPGDPEAAPGDSARAPRDPDRDDDRRPERPERSASDEGSQERPRPSDLERRPDRDHRPDTSTRTRPSGDQLRRDAAAYYAVASRRVERANVVPRIMRALRDALLIGLSLLVIWGVLYAAGIPIPFTTVLIAVGLIVVVSFGTGLYGQWRRSREPQDAPEDPRER